MRTVKVELTKEELEDIEVALCDRVDTLDVDGDKVAADRVQKLLERIAEVRRGSAWG